MNSLLKKQKRFELGVDIDHSLTTGDHNSERSLAEDCNEFAENFAGALSFSDDNCKHINRGRRYSKKM